MKTTAKVIYLCCLLILTLLLTSCHHHSSSGSSGHSKAQLIIEPRSLILYPNQERQFEAYLSQGSTKTPITQQASWSSDNTNIAEISPLGIVTAKSIGISRIKAYFEGQEATANVTVNDNTLVKITIEPTNSEIYTGEKIQYQAKGVFADQSTQDISEVSSWSVVDASIAMIDAKGLLEGLAIGTTTVNVQHTTLDAQANTEITVKPGSLTHLKMSSDSVDVIVGLARQLTATGEFNDGTSKDVSHDCDWLSNESSIASVNSQGMVTGESLGETQITASFNGLSATAMVSVKDANIMNITIDPDNFSLTKGYSQQLEAFASFNNNTSANITQSATWQSSDPSKASVDALGLVMGLAEGQVTISASQSGQTGQSMVTIKNPTLTSLTIYPIPAASELIVDTPQQLIAQGLFNDGSEQDLTKTVTWMSSDDQLASIISGGANSGLITPHQLGSAIFTATDPKTALAATCTLPIKNPGLTSITLEPEAPNIPVTTQIQMKATGTFSDGGQIDITTDSVWTVDSGEIAEISTEGLVTGKSIGSTRITASFLTQHTSTNLSVSAKKITHIEISPQNPSLKPVTAMWFTATAFYDDGSQQEVTKSGRWKSSSWYYASTVNWPSALKGYVHASGAQGTCDIIFEYQDMKVSTVLTIAR
ncbi:MAG: Ig-like domain-containing protein [Cellvibrionales bacterium]|nr:Ig-like domain-containing protein [Cellvibrionales bacterium]